MLIGTLFVADPISKIVKMDSVDFRLRGLVHKSSSKIVMTSGVFDLFHEAHSKYLLEARKQGDALVVGVDSDALVKKNKGDSRPLIADKDRAYVVASLEFVDLVVIMDDDRELIKKVRPKILVRSYSTNIKQEVLDEYRDMLSEHDGELVLLEPMSKTSTTALIEKIKSMP
jgi:rfaE bifunctional protein nucleotidyltransferase chain/domain